LERLDEETRTRVENAKDIQLDRAVDFLKGMLLYEARVHQGRSKVAVR
jgi:hypothetical protein